MQIIADLHLHSRFSRAVSRDLTILHISEWAVKKGIGLVGTADWTHPLWLAEIKTNLEEAGNGLLRLRSSGKTFFGDAQLTRTQFSRSSLSEDLPHHPHSPPLFILATEISCIYTQGGKSHRIHILVIIPSIDSATKINKELARRGCNLISDGRPIIGLSAIELCEVVFSVEDKAVIIPAHIWTPWFSLYGSMSGFDSIEEAFGDYAKNIFAVETGLSSSPDMNWRIKELEKRSIVSFSDAHSGPKLGREATVFEIPDGILSYESIYKAIKDTALSGETFFGDAQLTQAQYFRSSLNEAPPSIINQKIHQDSRRGFSAPQKAHPRGSIPSIAYTIEFYPEEGKYHYSGHKKCGIRFGPKEINTKGSLCPVCGKNLTQGVVQRVGELASYDGDDVKISNLRYKISDENTIEMVSSKAFPNRPPFVMLVPLIEIIAESLGMGRSSQKAESVYADLTAKFGGEFSVLLNTKLEDIKSACGERIAVGIEKVRKKDITIDPGYDGVFGVVKLWKEGEEKPLIDSGREQLSIF